MTDTHCQLPIVQLSTDFYDHERLVEINYPQNPENNVKYTYGEPGASNNRAGRIVIQEDGRVHKNSSMVRWEKL